MNHDPNDFKVGLIVLAVAAVLSILAAGSYGLGYSAHFVIVGAFVLFLLAKTGLFPRLIAIVLMPAVLLVKLLPKEFKRQIDRAASDETSNR